MGDTSKPANGTDNVLSEEKRQQVIALGRPGWPLRRIEKETGVRRETAGAYLKAAGVAVRPPRAWGRRPPAKPANAVSPGLDAGTPPVDPPDPAANQAPTHADPVAVPGRSPTASACEPYFDFIELSLSKGRNAKAIYQDLVDDHGFPGRHPCVKRFVRQLRHRSGPQSCPVIITPPGDESQADYGSGPMVRDPLSGRYRRTRMFVFTLGYFGDPAEGGVQNPIPDLALSQLPCQIAVAVAVDLEPEWTPGRHPHVAQPQLWKALHGSIAGRMHTSPGSSPRFARIPFARRSFRKLFLLRTNSISTALSAAICPLFCRRASRSGSAHELSRRSLHRSPRRRHCRVLSSFSRCLLAPVFVRGMTACFNGALCRRRSGPGRAPSARRRRAAHPRRRSLGKRGAQPFRQVE